MVSSPLDQSEEGMKEKEVDLVPTLTIDEGHLIVLSISEGILLLTI